MPHRLDYHRPQPPGFAKYVARLLTSRVAFVLAAAAVFLLTLLVHGVPNPIQLTALLVFDGGSALAWLLSAAGLGWLLLLVFRLPQQLEQRGAQHRNHVPSLLTLVTAAALGLGALSLATLGLGLCGWLNRVSAFALLVPGWAGLLTLLVQCLRRASAGEPKPREPITGWAWLWLLLIPPLALAVFCAFVPPGILWTPNEPHGYDVVEYHLQVPREWYEAGRIVPLHHNVFSYFPFNVEMHYLLAMHLRGGPWAGMYLAQLMHLTFMAMTVLAVYGFANRWAPTRASATLAGVAAGAVPWMTSLAPIAYNEGGLLLFGTLAIGWAIDATIRPGKRLARFPFAGAMAGFACGTKLTAVPEILLSVSAVCAAGIFLTRKIEASEESEPVKVPMRLAGVGAFVLCGLLTFSPWLIRNAVWTGNPLFPEAMSVLGRGHFSPVQVERWHRAHRPPPPQQPLPARLTAAWEQIIADSAYGYIFLPLVLLAICLGWRQTEVRLLAALLVLHALFWIGFTHLQGRFFVLAIPIGAFILAQADWSRAAPLVAVLVAAMVVVGLANVESHLRRYWFLSAAIGLEQLDALTSEAVRSVPPDATLKLIGDARAFYYQRPMSKLRYRTVFDVDARGERNIVDAWIGEPADLYDPGLLIDPAELQRFYKTYYGLPPVPDWVIGRTPRARELEPFIPAQDRTRR